MSEYKKERYRYFTSQWQCFRRIADYWMHATTDEYSREVIDDCLHEAWQKMRFYNDVLNWLEEDENGTGDCASVGR